MSCSHKKKTIEFYGIIFRRDQKSRLPKVFVGNNGDGIGNNLSNSILLRDPTGLEWQVKLRKSDNEVWFGKGWKDFVDYFSLKLGSLVVFRYHEGDSCFNVYKIYGPDRMKKEDPFKRSSKEANNGEKLRVPKVEEIQSDVSDEIMDDTVHGPKRRGKTRSPCFSPYKRMKTSHGNGTQSTWNVQKTKCKSSNGKISSPPAKEAGRGTSAAQVCRSSEALKWMLSLETKKKAMASLRASNFKSKYPFFVVAMQPAYIRGREMHIPNGFSKTHFTEKKGDIILQGLNGRRWSVCYYVNRKNSVAHFSRGWKDFVQDNNLEIGDTCIFELLESLEIFLRVIILRVSEDANEDLTAVHGSKTGHVRRKRNLTTQSKLDCDYTSNDEVITCRRSKEKSHNVPRRKTKAKCKKFPHEMQNNTAALSAVRLLSREGTCRAFQRACKSRFNHPHFKVVILPSFLHSAQPTIPAKFVKGYMKRIPEDVKLKFKNKSWSVKLCTCSDRPAKFASGWLAFALEINLKVGDVCAFEMIQRATFVFKVTIFRG